MYRNFYIVRRAFFAILAVFAVEDVPAAQSENSIDAPIEEIQVTATRRPADIRKVSAALTVVTSDEIARATEPFFTTKEPGKGLGLGLFLARSLAERFGGDLLIDSEPGQGSKVTFRVKLERVT